MEPLSGARVVVLGAAGFIGSHLTEALLEAEADVVAIDNMLTGRHENLADAANHAGMELVERDIVEGIEVPGEVDVVFDLASPASPRDYLALPIETMMVGSLGVRHALDLAESKGARFVMASTSEVYGSPRVHPQPESYWGDVNPIGPRSVYDEAKRFAEALTMAYRRTRRVNTGIVRIFNTYGPRMRIDDGRAVPNFIAAALEGRPLPIDGDGTQTRTFCYVGDLVSGLVLMASNDHPGPINLGGEEETSILSLARDIAELVGAELSVEYLPRPEDDPDVRRPDISLAEEVLGWRPSVSRREGLRHTIEWYRHATS